MATAAAALIARARREIQHHFFAADAVQPDRAVAFDPGSGIEGRQFERMRSRGIIHEAQPGLFWLDVVAYDVELRRRHSVQRGALLAIIAALLIAMALGALGVAHTATSAPLAH